MQYGRVPIVDGVTEGLDEKMSRVVREQSRRLAAMSNSILEEDLKRFGEVDAKGIQTAALMACFIDMFSKVQYKNLRISDDEMLGIITYILPIINRVILLRLVLHAAESVKNDGVTDYETMVEQAKKIIAKTIGVEFGE